MLHSGCLQRQSIQQAPEEDVVDNVPSSICEPSFQWQLKSKNLV